MELPDRKDEESQQIEDSIEAPQMKQVSVDQFIIEEERELVAVLAYD